MERSEFLSTRSVLVPLVTSIALPSVELSVRRPALSTLANIPCWAVLALMALTREASESLTWTVSCPMSTPLMAKLVSVLPAAMARSVVLLTVAKADIPSTSPSLLMAFATAPILFSAVLS